MGGDITEGKGLSIGYFAQQELDVLRLDEGPLQHMIRLAKEVSPQAREQELRDFLGRFRFVGEMVGQAVGSLSGGEKARLVLAMLVWQRPNLLLLDEPTNHLDLTTREALSMALNEFEGTVMLVSHDRALLREVCDEFWLVADGKVEPFDGDLDDYQKWLLDASREIARAQKEAARGVPVAKAGSANDRRDDRKAQAQAKKRLTEQTRPLRKEVERLDSQLAALAIERGQLEVALASRALMPPEMAERGRRLKIVNEEVELLEARWLELTEEIEALNTATTV